jgi:hypothetical protein
VESGVDKKNRGKPDKPRRRKKDVQNALDKRKHEGSFTYTSISGKH